MVLKEAPSVLAALQRLKSAPLQQQVRTIELLTEQNVDRFDAIKARLGTRSEDSIFQLTVSGDRQKVVRIAFLAVVAADIATVPHPVTRRRYIVLLEALCRQFHIDYDDVVRAQPHGSAIEDILVSPRS